MKTRGCALCGAAVGQNVAAHRCPHGLPCRFKCREDGSVLDWETAECPDCARAMLPGVALTAKGAIA